MKTRLLSPMDNTSMAVALEDVCLYFNHEFLVLKDILYVLEFLKEFNFGFGISFIYTISFNNIVIISWNDEFI